MLAEWSASGFMIHIQAEAGPHRSPIPRALTAHCFRHSGVGGNCTRGRVAYFSVLLFSCGLEQAESQTTLRGAGDSSNSSNNNKMNVMTSANVKRSNQYQERQLTCEGPA